MSAESPPTSRQREPWWKTAWGKIAAVVGFTSAVLGIVAFVQSVSSDPAPSSSAGPAPTATAAPGRPPVYRGAVGDLRAGEPFVRFIVDHDGQVVRIDADLMVQYYVADPPPPDAGVGFRVWDNCNGHPLPRLNPPKFCTGWEFDLAPRHTVDSSLYTGSGVHLEGWFGVNVRGNPNEGLNFVTLKPLTQGRALALASG